MPEPIQSGAQKQGLSTSAETPVAPTDNRDQTQDTILPCPFCGGNAETTLEREQINQPWRTGCMACGVEVISLDEQYTIDTWNERVAPSVPSGNAAYDAAKRIEATIEGK